MALTAVRHVLVDPSTAPREDVHWRAELAPGFDGFIAGGDEEVVAPVEGYTDATGLMVMNLVRNVDLVDTTAVWQVTYDNIVRYFQVPPTGPVDLFDVLTPTPTYGVGTTVVYGANGRGITGQTINGSGHLILTFDQSPTTVDLGAVNPGTAGAPGAAGDNGFANVTSSSYAGGAVTGPSPATDPALSINAALANASGKAAWVPDGMYYCQSQILFGASGQKLILAPGATLVRDFTSAGGWRTGLITHSLAMTGTKLNDVAIIGPGKLTTSTGNSGNMVELWGDRQVHDGYTIDAYENGLGWLIAGDSIRMRGLTLLTPRTHYNPNTGLTDYLSSGGIRYAAGKDFVATGCHIISGDDSLQFVPMQITFAHPFKNQSISGGRYIGCTGRSIQARFMAAVISDPTPGSMTCSVTDSGWTDCHGYGGAQGLSIRNRAPSTGVIDNITAVGCTVDQSLSVNTTTDFDVLVNRQDATGAVRNINLTGLTVRSPRGVTVKVDASPTYPVENLQIRGGVYEANASATWVMDLSAAPDVLLDGVTTAGGGTSYVLGIGLGANPSPRARVLNHRFLAVPGTASYIAVNYNDAPGSVLRDSVFTGGNAAQVVKAARFGTNSVNGLAEGNNVSALLNTGGGAADYWTELADTRLRGNVGDPLDSEFFPGAAGTIVSTAGTTRTFSANDATRPGIHFTAATAIAATLPLNATVPIAVGAVIRAVQKGAGQITVAGSGGVTLRSAGGALKTRAQYSVMEMEKIASDEWLVSGDVSV